jgi:hypothetical protein
MRKSDNNKNLQDLTNKFLTDFFEMATQNRIAEGKKNDDNGFAFNYILPETLLNSEYVQNYTEQSVLPLLDMGFAKNIVEGFFHKNTQGIGKSLETIITNFDKQDENSDWKALNLKTIEKTITEQIYRRSLGGLIDVEKQKTTHTFELLNLKNGNHTKVVVTYIDDKLDNTVVYLLDADMPKILSIKHTYDLIFSDDMTTYKKIDKDDCTIQQYRYTPDINGFFNTVEQVVYHIKNN